MDLLQLKQYEERSYEEMPSNNGWVNYGDDNLFPQYLIDLYKSSATHNALTTSIAYMIFGDGVQANTLEARLKMQEWNLDNEVRKACMDLKIQGGFALEVVYSIDRTTIAKVRHCPFENIRSAEVDNDEKVNFYYYSKDWADKSCKPELVRCFNPEDAVDHPVQILYVKPFSPGSYYYPKPDYIGSIDYIELDKEIGKYHINNIKNGLAPSFSIHFKNGVPTQEERFKIRNDIETQLSGATNAGKFIVTYSDSPDRKPDFEPFPLSDAHNQYQFLSEEVVAKIMVGHRVTNPMLFGVMVSGKLGSGLELATSDEIFTEDVIEPYQKIVEEALSSIFTAAGTPCEVHLQAHGAEEANVDISYTGAQITSAIEVISKVRTGELTIPQATEILVAMLGFDREMAEQMFYNVDKLPALPSAETELSEHVDLNIDAADWLIEQGEEMDEDEWELIDERPFDPDTEAVHDALWTFAYVPSSKPQASSEMDNDIIKVRYTYDGSKSPEREFCRKMMSAKRVYRKEDIVGPYYPEQLGGASSRAVNPGFGPNGTDTYDLLLFKGGPQCKHRWIRRTYLKRNNKRVSVNEARRIINDLPPEIRAANPLPPNDDPRISQWPITMPNNGYLNPR
jgi:hypothetical protein